MRSAILLVGLVAAGGFTGCKAPESEGRVLQGFSYRWQYFNHRVSYVHVDGSQALTAGVIGGTSTTGVQPSLGAECDPDSCGEFPFIDFSDVDVSIATVRSNRVQTASGALDLKVGRDGATGTLELPMENRAVGEAVALLQGLTLNTATALTSGEASCYDPAFGWHPRRIVVELGDVTLVDGGDAVSVPVSATFDAGNALEEVRKCVDEVQDEAQVDLRVALTVVAGNVDRQFREVDYTQEYAYSGNAGSPGDQPDPDLSVRTQAWEIEAPLVGWQRIDYAFHEQDPALRGAYPRLITFEANADGLVTGHANNYSPGTQLSDFEVHFRGTAVAVDVGGEVVVDRFAVHLPAELGSDGVPTNFSLTDPEVQR